MHEVRDLFARRHRNLNRLAALGARLLRYLGFVHHPAGEPSALAGPLEAVDWRLERANEHLTTLNRERDAFLDEKNRSIVGEFDRNTSEYVFRFGGKLPDPRIGIVVSEFAHHLRAALDNLVWQLVLLRGGIPTRRTEFPIEESRKRYQQRLRRGALRGISADDRAAIEAVQPYKLGKRAPKAYLTLLAWLNNVDKHRFVHVGGILPQRFPIPVFLVSAPFDTEGQPAGEFPWQFAPIQDVGEILGYEYVPTTARQDRTELLRVRIEPSGPNPEMDVKSDAPIEIGLSDPERSLDFADLSHIRDVVVLVIDHFRPRFNEVIGVS